MPNELETIVMQKLKEISAEYLQEVKILGQQIQEIRKTQKESEEQLMRLSGLYKNLQPLVDQLNGILSEKT